MQPVKPVEVKTIAERPPMYHPPLPMEMQLTDVKFEVLTPALMGEYLALIKEGNAPAKPYYALTTKPYENLAINIADMRRYLNQQQQIIVYYEKAVNTPSQKNDRK